MGTCQVLLQQTHTQTQKPQVELRTQYHCYCQVLFSVAGMHHCQLTNKLLGYKYSTQIGYFSFNLIICCVKPLKVISSGEDRLRGRDCCWFLNVHFLLRCPVSEQDTVIIQNTHVSPSSANPEETSRGSGSGGVWAPYRQLAPLSISPSCAKRLQVRRGSGRWLFKWWCHLCFVIPPPKDIWVQSVEKQSMSVVE